MTVSQQDGSYLKRVSKAGVAYYFCHTSFCPGECKGDILYCLDCAIDMARGVTK